MHKKIALYSILATMCIALGFLESLLPTNFIAPGIKPGLANALPLLLILRQDIGGAFIVNITRIFLSALLFGTPFSLLFSLAGGLCSLLIMSLVRRLPFFSPAGFGVLGAAAHNLAQTLVAALLIGRAVWYYFPLLLLTGTCSGAAVGILSEKTFAKMQTNGKF